MGVSAREIMNPAATVACGGFEFRRSQDGGPSYLLPPFMHKQREGIFGLSHVSQYANPFILAPQPRVGRCRAGPPPTPQLVFNLWRTGQSQATRCCIHGTFFFESHRQAPGIPPGFFRGRYPRRIPCEASLKPPPCAAAGRWPAWSRV